jgi:cold shock CspA family protein
MAHGTVQWVNAQQGVGFKALQEGDAVELTVTQGSKGPQA